MSTFLQNEAGDERMSTSSGRHSDGGCAALILRRRVGNPDGGGLGAGAGGGGYALVACVSHLAIDHASLSRRKHRSYSLHRHLQHLGADYVPSLPYIKTVCLSYLFPIWSSVATIYLLG